MDKVWCLSICDWQGLVQMAAKSLLSPRSINPHVSVGSASTTSIFPCPLCMFFILRDYHGSAKLTQVVGTSQGRQNLYPYHGHLWVHGPGLASDCLWQRLADTLIPIHPQPH